MPYRSRERTNDVEYERDCMYKAEVRVGFVVGQETGLSPITFCYLVNNHFKNAKILSGIMNWYNGSQYQGTHTLSQRTANTTYRCSKTRIINIVVDVFMKGSVLFSTLLQPFFFYV